MINHLIAWSLRNRFLVVCGVFFLIAFGTRALYRTPVDAIPDLSENQVIVFADWAGRSPQEVEDQVTYPLSVGLQGLAGVKTVRANSMFGFSMLTIIFEERVDNYFARTRVLERLNLLAAQLPAGVVPQLGPDATGLGWVYQYYLHVDPAHAHAGALTNSASQLSTLSLPTTSASFARCRTGSSVTSSTPCRASRKWRASAASCASIKLKSARLRCARARSR